jgi:hypothetical protein
MKRGEPHELHKAAALTPEAQLLLLCARTTLDEHQRQSLRERCGADLDWAIINQLAARHGLYPLLHRHLEGLEAGAIPRKIQASLWARHETLCRRNRFMARELVDIVDLLAREGIRVVPYKGPTLAVAAYGDLGLREFGDLDLLVRSKDALRIQGLLRARGYRPEYALTCDLEQALVRSRRHYELPLRDEARGLLVELHWRADPDIEAVPLGDDAWWRELERIDLLGASVPMLRMDDLMLILCLHGTKHAWASLGWLVDVAELARRPQELNWESIAGRANRLGVARKLGVTVTLCRELLDVSLPREALRTADDLVVRRVAAEISATLFEPVYRTPSVARIVRRNVELQEGASTRLRYLIHVTFTPGLGEWQRWQLPRRWHFLYAPLRLARLAEKYLLRRIPAAATPRTRLPPRRSTG